MSTVEMNGGTDAPDNVGPYDSALFSTFSKVFDVAGIDVVCNPAVFLSYVLDLCEMTSVEAKVLERNCDEVTMVPYMYALNNPMSCSVHDVSTRAQGILTDDRGIDSQVAKNLCDSLAIALLLSGAPLRDERKSTVTKERPKVKSGNESTTERAEEHTSPRSSISRRALLTTAGISAIAAMLGGFTVGRMTSTSQATPATETKPAPTPTSKPTPTPQTEPDPTSQQKQTSSAPVASVYASWRQSLALLEDGTVKAIGHDAYGELDVSQLQNVKQITSGEYHTVALLEDGRVKALGLDDDGQCDVTQEQDIVAVAGGDYHTVMLRSDGTVSAVGYDHYGQCDVSEWRGVVAVDARWHHTVGLMSDGTVVATGFNDLGQCDVGEWRGVVAISAGWCHTVGVLADGTAVAVGYDGEGRCDVGEWKDIKRISAGDRHTVALLQDGTVVATGENDYGQCNVDTWRNVVDVSAGSSHTLALLADGTVVATGDNKYGQCNVEEW